MNRTIIEQIQEDAKKSLKKGEKTRVGVLRYLLSLLQSEEARLNRKMAPEEALALLQKEMKKKKEALSMFRQGKRDDLVREQGEEIEILSEYLPEMLGREEIEEIVREIVGAEPSLNFGQVMGKTMAQAKGRAGGKIVAQVVKEVLG